MIRRAELPPAAPGQPGPFRLGAPGIAQAALERAGFTDVRAQTIDAPAQCGRVRALRARVVRRAAPDALRARLRQAAWDEIAERLAEFEGPGGFVGPCELHIVSGTQR